MRNPKSFRISSIEFFTFNADSTTGSPLIPVQQLEINIGAVNQYAFKEVDDTIAWIGSTAQSKIGIYVLNGLNPKKVSNPYIESQLATSTTAGIFVTAGKIVGKTFLVVTSSVGTFVYVVEDDMWHEWSGQVRYWHKFAANTAATPVVYSITRDDTSGKVFKLNPVSPVFTDNGNTYTMTIQTSKFDMDKERRKFLHKLAIIGDTSESSSTFNVSWSDDDYVTFSSARTIDISSNRTYLTNCGSFRRRAFKLTNSSAYPVRLEALELEVSEGLH